MRWNIVRVMVAVLLVSLIANPLLAATPSRGSRLVLPSLNVQARIVEVPFGRHSWNTTRLGHRIGHLKGTAWVGQGSNVVLIGHYVDAQLAPSIFYTLDQIQIGDAVQLTQRNQTYTYIVSEKFYVDLTNLEILYPTLGDRLTLITCAGEFDEARADFTQRLVVVALPVTP
jgi:LPXTG-site transpeptidase (sortase) family protein